jgi:predicted MPP superfamily phosphohydrolase
MEKNRVLWMGLALALLLNAPSVFAQLKYTVSQDLAVIKIPGVQKKLRILHISDSHITFPGEKDKEFESYSNRMAKAYMDEVDYRTKKPLTGAEAFSKLMDKAVEQKIDLIALTGDIINYPSEHAVNFVLGELKRTGIPFVYVSGNHDWHFEGMKGSDFELRQTWRERFLKSLYEGNDYDCSARMMNGIDIIAIDNSTYQITAKQLEFYRREKAKGLPMVLLMHIPVYMETNDECCMGWPRWGAATDHLYQLERREQWSEKGNSRETLDFCNEIQSTKNVVVLAGHVHHNAVSAENDMLQIISDISRRAYARVIELIP